jgi:transposase-like protein
MKQKTYETALFDLITTEFGYIGGPEVVSLFVRKIVELNNEYYRPEHYVKPGQMRWLAVKADEKYGKGKTMRDMKLVPITLTIINEGDIDEYCNGVDNREKRQRFIKRIYQEAREQGGVLPEVDAAVILRLSKTTISKLILNYEKRTGEVIPRCGTEMDMGRTLTHKKLAFHNFKKKMTTTENAKSIDHSPESVDRYIKDGTRVEKLYNAGYGVWDIAYLTGLSISVVNQYVDVINEYTQKKYINRKNKISK